ncbi:hypothetical protein F5B18DRAFT_630946 [Nemania serpens]|nr:hypothetical protein F5B18DRAFT_630946 [Nemania serpens]
MSSKTVEDVKAGVKGIRGAGDALRGNLMQAADQAFDGGNKPGRQDPTTQASELKNQAIADKGKRDINVADDMLARREREREAKKLERQQVAGANAGVGTGVGASTGLAGNGAGAPKGTGHHPLPLQ